MKQFAIPKSFSVTVYISYGKIILRLFSRAVEGGKFSQGSLSHATPEVLGFLSFYLAFGMAFMATFC